MSAQPGGAGDVPSDAPEGWFQSTRKPPEALFMARRKVGDEGAWITPEGLVNSWDEPPVEVRAWLYERWLAWRATQ